MSAVSWIKLNKTYRTRFVIYSILSTFILLACEGKDNETHGVKDTTLPRSGLTVSPSPILEDSIKLEAFFNTTPPAPILISPDDRSERNPGLNQPDDLTFRWRVGSVPAGGVSHYKFNLCHNEPEGKVCDPAVNVSRSRQYKPNGGLSPMIYQGRDMEWWVEGCRMNNCAESEIRKLSWPLPAPDWVDIQIIGEFFEVPLIITGNLVAMWTPVYGADAGYLFCISDRRGAVCPNAATGTGGSQYVKHANDTSIEVPVAELIPQLGGRTAWIKLAACTRSKNPPNLSCTYQSNWKSVDVPTEIPESDNNG